MPALKAATPPGEKAGAPADFSARRWQASAGLQHRHDARVHQLSGETMGTNWSLRLANPEFAPLDGARASVQSVLDLVIAQMSNWERDSLISRFNGLLPGSEMALPGEFALVLDAAMHWAGRSGGAIDPTMGALVSLWGFGPRPDPMAPHARVRPESAVIDEQLAVAGFARMPWAPGQRHLVQPGGLRLDLCGIAKGFAVDRVVEALAQQGWTGGLFEIGGELRGWGEKPDGRDWQIRVGTADSASEAMVVGMRDGALATSGDLWHHFLADGKRYSHTIDPRTGRPVEHALASVTVHHAECMHADALATVLTVLGLRDGMQFAIDNDIAAVFRDHANEARVGDGNQLPQAVATPAWKARFAS
ncbi:MAG: FAD:protein FMN transferase [Burkholderiaceae bacterium]|nr:FAD:protein FMN transferase [Burkholderiaceae bacterium]